MKKIICILAILALSALPSRAFPCFGIKGGYNLSTMTAANSPIVNGGHVGLFAGFDLHLCFGTRAEVLFSWQGGSVPLSNGSYTSFNAQYIKVPLTLRYVFAGSFYAEAGISFDALINHEFQQSNRNNMTLTPNDFDFSIPVGVGYSVVLRGIGSLDISARYYVSTLPAFKELPGIRNSTFSFSVGFSFGGMMGSKLGAFYD